MTRPKHTKLAAPYDYMELTIQSSLVIDSPLFDRVCLTNTDTGNSTSETVPRAEATAKAVLSAIRKHKAQIKRDAAKNEEAGA